MNSLIDLFQQPLFYRIGWVLVHFLWQGAGIGLLLAIALRLIHNASSHLRYLVICGALLACGMAPVITWVELAKQAAPNVSQEVGGNFETQTSISQKPPLEDVSGTQNQSSIVQAVTGSEGPSARHGNYRQIFNLLLPYAVALWFAGVMILTLRLALGWAQVLRVRWSGTAVPDPAWHERFRLLAERMRVRAPVWLFKSALVEVPTLIGWLRPVILLPASAFTGLTTAQLEAVLAHELAHVMRYDYVVNFLQTTIEAVLFYHPVVWWIGRKLREERENCCDDIAIETTRDRATYASALATLEESRAFAPALALAASDGMLLARIRRIVGVDRGKSSFLPVVATVLIVGSLLAPLGSRIASGQDSSPKPNESEVLESATKENPFVNSLDMKFVPVPGTKVLFSIWDTRVKDYRDYVEENSGVDAGWRDAGFKQGGDHPVVNVSWEDAKAFCAWLTQKERKEGKIGQDQEYRLPTDKEWNAAVGKGKYPWGNDWPPPEGAGNYADETLAKAQLNDAVGIEGYDDGYAYTSPVGSFKANQYGLYDMGGNVWQWCEDWYDAARTVRVIRGASWSDGGPRPGPLVSSTRYNYPPANRKANIGFRCVLALKDSQAASADEKRAVKLDASHNADNHDGLNPLEGAKKENPFENSLGMKFVPVPGAKVLFSIWDTRVQDYRAYAESRSGVNESWKKPGFKQFEDHPVVNVSWEDAKAFCAWLTRKDREEGKIGENEEYRLPTDEEWSAAVGDTNYPWGDQWPPPKDAGNYNFIHKVGDYEHTSPVGSFPVNRYGLYDMGGNVWQWCEDWYQDEMNEAAYRERYDFLKDDGGGEKYHVLRGQCCFNGYDPEELMSSRRNIGTPDRRDVVFGFRCVLAPKDSHSH